MNREHIEQAIGTLERARDDAIEKLAGGNPAVIKQLEEATKGIDILRGLQDA